MHDRKLELWRTAVMNLGCGVIIGDVTGKVLAWNDAVVSGRGLPPGEDPREHLELSPPGGPPLAPSDWPMARTIRGETVRDLELRMRRRDTGDVRQVLFSTAIVPSPEGGPDLIVMTVFDVTELRRQEAERNQSLALLQAVTEGTSDAVFVKDREGRYLLVNRAGCEYAGLPRESILGHTDESLFDTASVTLIRQRDLQAMQAEGPMTHDEGLTTQDGTRRTYLVTKAPYRDTHGEVVGVVGISRDITGRKAVEEALRESERRFKQLVDAMPQIVWTTGPDGKLEYVNQRGVSILGSPIPDDPMALVAPEDRAWLEQRWKESLRTGEPFAEEHRLRLPDGQYHWFLHREEPERDPDGQIIRWYATATDITEHKALEAQLAHAQKMEAVGRLAGGVAHDFNNMLTVINGHCSLLLEALPEDFPHREELIAIQDAGSRSACLTRQLLAFSRQEKVDPRILDLNQLLREMERLLRRLIGEDVTIRLKLASDLPPLKADPGQLEQLVLNLAINARDAMPAGGTFTLETRPCPDGLELIVSDDGAGIPEAIQNKIFEPFFTTKPTGQGTGLGLSVVHGVVRQMEGHISVHSALGTGTTFTVRLPRAVGTPTSPATDGNPAAKPAEGRLVLLVEDEASVRKIVTLTLRRHGYRVLEAGCGEEALQLESTCPDTIDLLLTDVVMPGLSGPQTAEAFLTRRPGTPVLMMSGYAPEEIYVRGVNHGQLLSKPFSPAALVERVALTIAV